MICPVHLSDNCGCWYNEKPVNRIIWLKKTAWNKMEPTTLEELERERDADNREQQERQVGRS